MQNKYIVYLGRMVDGEAVPHTEIEYEAFTHVLAAKAVSIQYPDLCVMKVVQRWYPIDNCHLCGSPIFAGDYQNDQIRQREGRKRCLECY